MLGEIDPEFRLPTTVETITQRRCMGGLGIGLTGAHRTGKTTVCKVLSETNGFPFLKSSTTEIAKDLGIDLSKPISLKHRCEFQTAVLGVFSKVYEKHGRGIFVCDRTPLDLAAYLLADVPTEHNDPATDEFIQDYVGKCFEVTNRHFATITLVQPGIAYVAEPGKPLPSASYQEKIAALISGLCADERLHVRVCRLPKSTTGLVDRVNFVAKAVQTDLARAYDEARTFARA
jgi:hypothetical protein